MLETADRRAYQDAARILKKARSAAQAAGRLDAFSATVASLREAHRRRPALLEILDRVKLTGEPETT